MPCACSRVPSNNPLLPQMIRPSLAKSMARSLCNSALWCCIVPLSKTAATISARALKMAVESWNAVFGLDSKVLRKICNASSSVLAFQGLTHC